MLQLITLNTQNKMHIDPTTNRPEITSDTKGSFDRINSQAAFSKKKVKTNFSYNKVFRQPGECRISTATIARKAATAARIEKIKRAGEKYRVMAANPESKVGKDGVVFVQKREGGRFGQKLVLLS